MAEPIKFTELSNVGNLSASAIMAVVQQQGGELVSLQCSAAQMADLISSDIEYQNLTTEGKTLIEAINEAAQTGGGGDVTKAYVDAENAKQDAETATIKDSLTELLVEESEHFANDYNFTYDELTVGYITQTGNISVSTSYHRTEKIPCIAGDTFAYKKPDGSGATAFTTMPYSGDTPLVAECKVNYQSFTIPNGADGVIISFSNAQVTNGVTIHHEGNREYKGADKSLSKEGKVAESKSVGEAIQKVAPKPTANILPDEPYKENTFLNVANGRIYEVSNSAYACTDTINVEIGHTYKLVTRNPLITNIVLFGAEFSDGIQTTGASRTSDIRLNETVTVSKNCLRLFYDTILIPNLKDLALVDTAKTEDFEAYGTIITESLVLSTKQIRDIKDIVKGDDLKPLYGKKILSLGDSYTWLNFYGKYLEKVTGATQRGRGQNGNVLKSFCNDSYTGADGTPISEVFDATLLADYDIVTVMGGTNDYGHGTATLGTISDDITANTIYGSVKYIIDKILTIKPTIKIVFCTQPYRLQYSTETAQGGYEPNANGLTMENIANAIVDCCGHYGIPCFDFYHKSNWNPWTVRKENGTLVTNIYTYDGLHPKDADGNGADLLGSAFGEFLNSLYPRL